MRPQGQRYNIDSPSLWLAPDGRGLRVAGIADGICCHSVTTRTRQFGTPSRKTVFLAKNTVS
jgi:hypothetical protein